MFSLIGRSLKGNVMPTVCNLYKLQHRSIVPAIAGWTALNTAAQAGKSQLTKEIISRDVVEMYSKYRNLFSGIDIAPNGAITEKSGIKYITDNSQDGYIIKSSNGAIHFVKNNNVSIIKEPPDTTKKQIDYIKELFVLDVRFARYIMLLSLYFCYEKYNEEFANNNNDPTKEKRYAMKEFFGFNNPLNETMIALDVYVGTLAYACVVFVMATCWPLTLTVEWKKFRNNKASMFDAIDWSKNYNKNDLYFVLLSGYS